MLIKAINGIDFQISECDYDLIMKSLVPNRHWTVSKNIVIGWCFKNNIPTRTSLHRLLMHPIESWEDVDHVNRDSLDNRRENLRKCSHQNNRFNSNKWYNRKYKGVSIYPFNRNRFRARIKINDKSIHLGIFESEELAAKAYDKAAKVYFGEFANLNFKEEV